MNRLKKVGAIVAIIIINVLTFGIIPLNILLIWKDFPQWIMILASVVDIAAVLLMARKTFAGNCHECFRSYVCAVGICLPVLE